MSRIVKKLWKLTLKSVIGLIVIVLISLLLLLWRLSSSPIQLNQFVPGIEQAASDLPGGLSVRLEGIGLYWDRDEKQIDLRALNVELVESSGTSLVTAPEVDVSLSVFALMRGVVAVSSIEVNDLDVQLVRSEDGSFKVFRKTNTGPVTSADNKPKDFSETVQHLFKVLASEADTQAPLSYLKRIKLKGSLEVEDRKSDLHWEADAVESLFVGHKGEIKGDLGVSFSSPKALDGIQTDIALSVKDDVATASLKFTGLMPTNFATLDERLASLTGLDINLNGSIDITLTLPDTIHTLSANIVGGAGQISYQDYYPQPLKVNSLDLKLDTDLQGKSLHVSSLDLSLGEETSPLSLHLNGSAKMLENEVAVKLETTLQQLKVNEFDLYWPKAVANGARSWLVNNMKAGAVNRAKLDLAMDVPTGPEAKFQLKILQGTVAYSDLTVGYFGALPPATGVTGSGTFDQRGFYLDVNKGLVNGVSIQSGKVVITGMDNKKAAISIRTQLNGQLSDIYEVLESPPLELSSSLRTGVVSQQPAGQVIADFNISLPLKAGLAGADIQYKANGKVTGGELDKIIFNYKLEEANLDFSLDQSKVNFHGPLKFSGIPLTVDWTTFLTGPDKGHTSFTTDAPNITDTQISALGFDVHEYMQGSVAMKSDAKLTPEGLIMATIQSDFNNAELEVPQIHWHKGIGEGGNISLSLSAKRHHLQASNIAIELGNLKTSGDVQFEMNGGVMSLSLEHLSLSFAELNDLKLERNESKNLKFTLQGGEASLEPFLAESDQVIDPSEKQVLSGSKTISGQIESIGVNLEIGESKLDKLYLNKETYLDNIKFSGRSDNRGWQEVRVSGHDPSARRRNDINRHPAATEVLGLGEFRVAFGPSESSQYPLHIEVEDLGSLLSTVKGKNLMKSGYLVIDGTSQGPLLTKPLQANAKLSHFTVKEAPTISSVLNLASFTQIISTFRQTGLAFNSGYGDLQLDGLRLSSKHLRMQGGSLAVVGSGWVDFKQQNIDITGTIVPLSNINRVVGKIPLFGRVVTGKDGHGIMAVDYTAKGAIGDPVVSIRKESLSPEILENALGTEDELPPPQPR